MSGYELQYRTTFEDIAAHYSTMEEAFADGNYTYVAAFAEEDPELRGCAYVMLGHPEKGISILDENSCDSERSLFHRAIGRWFMGDKPGSLALMDRIVRTSPESSTYRQVHGLIQKERIKVLVMNKEFDTKKLLGNDVFDIVTIGRSFNDDIRIGFDSDADSILKQLETRQWTPHFLFVFRPEYLVLPKGLEQLPFPKIAFCSDYDLHLYQKYNDFRKFDKIVVYTSVDHFESKRLFDKPVFTHIFSHTIDPAFAGEPSKEKKYDILLTGSSFKTFFSDKSILISALTALDPQYNVLINDGFVSRSGYEQLMQEARVVPTFVRFYGCFPTRGVEALAAGTSVLYPEKGVLELFFHKDADPIFPYGSTTLCEDATNAIRHSHAGPNATAAEGVKIFSPKRSIEQFFKFCSIVSLFPPALEATVLPERDDLYVVGYHTLHGTTGSNLTLEEISADFRKMNVHNRRLKRSKHTVNSLAINYVYQRQHVDFALDYVSARARQEMIDSAVTVLKEGIVEFPDALVLYFNLARILFHYGRVQESLETFKQMLASRHLLKLDRFQDDIMSGMFFFDEYFPYRHYVDAVIKHQLKETGDEGTSPESIIYSGVYYYLGAIFERVDMEADAIESCKLSLELNPDNFITKHLMVRLLHSGLEKGGQLSELSLLVRCYEESTQAYCRYFHPDIVYYADALAALGMHEKLKAALCQWFLFYKRTRQHCEVLPIESAFIEKILSFSEFLPEEGRRVLKNVNDFVNGARGCALSEFEDEIIFKLYKTEGKLEQLAKAVSEGYRPRKSSVYLEIALHLSKGASLLKALPFYLVYLKETHYFGLGSAEGLRRGEILDFIVTVAKKWPRLYMLLRYLYYGKMRLLFSINVAKHA